MKERIIIDSSPIIFLSKINALEILIELFPRGLSTINKVSIELNKGFVPADELLTINNFLKGIEIFDTDESIITSSTLSRTDKELVTFGMNNNYDLLITDDNLLRRISQYENLNTIGTLGVLVQCAKKKVRTVINIRNYIDSLVLEHKMRISVELYSEIMNTLNKM